MDKITEEINRSFWNDGGLEPAESVAKKYFKQLVSNSFTLKKIADSLVWIEDTAQMAFEDEEGGGKYIKEIFNFLELEFRKFLKSSDPLAWVNAHPQAVSEIQNLLDIVTFQNYTSCVKSLEYLQSDNRKSPNWNSNAYYFYKGAFVILAVKKSISLKG